MAKRRRPLTEKPRAVYVLPVWLIQAVKFDAAKLGVSYSHVVESILARHVSVESRRQANEPQAVPTAAPSAAP